MRNTVLNLINKIQPFDNIEEKHIQDAKKWIESGSDIFRYNSEQKNLPSKHLSCYWVLYNAQNNLFLLFEHKKSWLILPPWGHPEQNEHPTECIKREMEEELNFKGDFFRNNNEPFFISQVLTGWNSGNHIDIDLRYVFKANEKVIIDETAQDYKKEFWWYKWYNFEEISSLKKDRTDEHIERFIKKLLDSNITKIDNRSIT